MNSLGVEKPREWFDADHKNGYAAETVAHLVLMVTDRARRLGYGRRDLVRLLDAAGLE
jgi:hypothetical protein